MNASPQLQRIAKKVMQAWRNMGLLNDGTRKHYRERRAWYWSRQLEKQQNKSHLLAKSGRGFTE